MNCKTNEESYGENVKMNDFRHTIGETIDTILLGFIILDLLLFAGCAIGIYTVGWNELWSREGFPPFFIMLCLVLIICTFLFILKKRNENHGRNQSDNNDQMEKIKRDKERELEVKKYIEEFARYVVERLEKDDFKAEAVRICTEKVEIKATPHSYWISNDFGKEYDQNVKNEAFRDGKRLIEEIAKIIQRNSRTYVVNGYKFGNTEIQLTYTLQQRTSALDTIKGFSFYSLIIKEIDDLAIESINNFYQATAPTFYERVKYSVCVGTVSSIEFRGRAQRYIWYSEGYQLSVDAQEIFIQMAKDEITRVIRSFDKEVAIVFSTVKDDDVSEKSLWIELSKPNPEYIKTKIV